MEQQKIISAINNSLQLQNNLNTLVNPNWTKANYKWRRAMWVEAGELVDIVGYKWWKNVNTPIDEKQALLELVDIFHFILSEVIIANKYKSDQLYHQYVWATKHTFAKTKEDKLEQIEEFVSLCVDPFTVTSNLVTAFFQCVVALGFNIVDILKYYIGKNALNKFRQDNGYKAGTYKKQWNFNGSTVEDNVVLEHIVENGTVLDFDNIYAQLKTLYATT